MNGSSTLHIDLADANDRPAGMAWDVRLHSLPQQDNRQQKSSETEANVNSACPLKCPPRLPPRFSSALSILYFLLYPLLHASYARIRHYRLCHLSNFPYLMHQKQSSTTIRCPESKHHMQLRSQPNITGIKVRNGLPHGVALIGRL